jgi:hypothetical protein
VLEERLRRLAELGFELAAASEFQSHFIVERDGFVALVERKEHGFGNIGAPGLVTERGFAALVWRGNDPWFVAKGFEQRATPGQVEAIRRFSVDLKDAIGD